MNKLVIAAVVSLSLPAFAQFPDTNALKGAADKAGQSAAAEAQVQGKKEVKKVATEQVENKVNAKLLAEARKNQCAFKSNTDQFEGRCDKQVQNLFQAVIDAKKVLKDAGVEPFKFEVSGHTDSIGDAAKNKALSEKRAARMVSELKKKGVADSEIIAVGMGSEHMLVKPDDTKAKQVKNRRYEVRVRLTNP